MSSPADFVCPDAQYHGNPFRYCPVEGCGWMEKRTAAPEPVAGAAMSGLGFVEWIDAELVAAEAKRNRCAAAHNVDGHLLAVGRIDALREVRALITGEAQP